MGFVYKLTPQISAFIIEQKRAQPKATCQAISGMIYSQFNERVSKSSVHFLLKQSQVIVPRARKVKEKFEIPAQKKEQISKALAPFASSVLPQKNTKQQDTEAVQAKPQTILEQIPVKPIEAPKPLQKPKVFKTIGDIFLKCALYDLSLKPVFGIKGYEEAKALNYDQIKFEWKYLTGLVYGIKIQMKDQGVVYLDPRFQGIYDKPATQEELAAPIERVAFEVADYILNNIKPLIIRKCDSSSLESTSYSFIDGMNNQDNRQIQSICLMDEHQKTLAEFNHPLISTRYFILSIDKKAKQYQGFMEKLQQNNCQILEEQDHIIVTNLNNETYDKVKDMFWERHPQAGLALWTKHLNVSNKENLSLESRLQERCRMFFPENIPAQDLENIFKLEGFEEDIVDEKQNITGLHVIFPINIQSSLFQALTCAAQNINALNITDYQGKKIKISLHASSE